MNTTVQNYSQDYMLSPTKLWSRIWSLSTEIRISEYGPKNRENKQLTQELLVYLESYSFQELENISHDQLYGLLSACKRLNSEQLFCALMRSNSVGNFNRWSDALLRLMHEMKWFPWFPKVISCVKNYERRIAGILKKDAKNAILSHRENKHSVSPTKEILYASRSAVDKKKKRQVFSDAVQLIQSWELENSEHRFIISIACNIWRSSLLEALSDTYGIHEEQNWTSHYICSFISCCKKDGNVALFREFCDRDFIRDFICARPDNLKQVQNTCRDLKIPMLFENIQTTQQLPVVNQNHISASIHHVRNEVWIQVHSAANQDIESQELVLESVISTWDKDDTPEFRAITLTYITKLQTAICNEDMDEYLMTYSTHWGQTYYDVLLQKLWVVISDSNRRNGVIKILSEIFDIVSESPRKKSKKWWFLKAYIEEMK